MSLEVSATLKRRVSHPFFIFFFCNLSLSITERRKRTTYEPAPAKIAGEKAEDNTVPEPAPAKDESCTDSDAKIAGGTEEIGAVKVEGGDKDESRSLVGVFAGILRFSIKLRIRRRRNEVPYHNMWSDDEYGVYRSDSETRRFPQADGYYGPVEFDEVDHAFGSHKVQPEGENVNTKGLSSSPLHESFDSQVLQGTKKLWEEAKGRDNGSECEVPSSLYGVDGTDVEPVNFENNGLLWLPPEPEDEEDEREAVLFDDEDARGEWGYLRSSSSFGSGECCSRDRSSEEHRKAMKNVVDGHFRALVAQLLQVKNLPMGEEDEKESWLEIITALSWEAATLLKPETSKGGGMDPGGYVKIQCIACGSRNASIPSWDFNIVNCHYVLELSDTYRRIHKSRINEMDHLKMAVAKIDAHHPNVLLVEKSVSRFARDYLLAKDISLVLNIKRPLLERIARCTGAQIVPSIDHLSSQKLGYSDTLHVEKFLEEYGSAEQGWKKLLKTLMFFEGCPKPLGLKHVVHYGVFAAYHLALETSFLEDEGASLPELPLKSPITVAWPDKPSSIYRSISTIPSFTVLATGKPQGPQPRSEPHRYNNVLASDLTSPSSNASIREMERAISLNISEGPSSQCTKPISIFINSSASGQVVSSSYYGKLSPYIEFEEKNIVGSECFGAKTSVSKSVQDFAGDHLVTNGFASSEPLGQVIIVTNTHIDGNAMVANQLGSSELAPLQQDSYNYPEEQGSSK
ncbi:hypothetical protein HHK36_023266 [Tetracentron sinense]|uniref:Uncharacterized protein n=1 Tax=Tetracentron sinense TaxID=13715 RepID=A0A834YSU4_TETSI|nr:hypothetical protein HHK36_023266 [Tetracentron sinense]